MVRIQACDPIDNSGYICRSFQASGGQLKVEAAVQPLFRREAISYRADRLQGSVRIATPLAWQLVGFLLLVALVAVISFLCLATYARVENVTGSIALDKGVASIVPSRSGLVEEIAVSDGQRVHSGQKLAVIRSEESMVKGANAPERISDALNRQDEQLADQGRLLLLASAADQERLKAQIDGSLAAISALESQIADQKQLITAAEADYDNAKEVAARGYISKRDMDQRQATILTRKQQLAQLLQALSDKRAEILQTKKAIAQAAASAQAQAANAQSARESLSQQRAQADLSRGYALTAPVDGVVTAITARLGQPATTDQPLMIVVPTRARPTVELLVPTTAAGFLAPGQEVRLSIDAFPYQTYGTVEARIDSISRAAITKQIQGGTASVYLVVASIPKPWVLAFGRKQPLLPGMSLSARIVTERRSLVEWLFEPLFAVRKR